MLARLPARSLACLHSLSREILMALQGTEMRAEAALSPLSPSLCSASEANLLWPFVRRRRAASVVATIAVNLAIRPERIAHPSNASLPLFRPWVTPRYILSTDARPNFPNFASRLGSWCSRQTVQVARAPHWLFKIIYDPGQGVSHKQQKSKDYCRAFP